MLQHKNAIIYGGAGSLGSAVARSLAAAGARIFLTGRHLDTVQPIADEIMSSGGQADASECDALNEQAVKAHIDSVVKTAGSVDISFCAIDFQVVQNMPLVDMKVDDFVRPVTLAMQSHFLTATAAAKVMMKQRSGVILSLTATPGGIGYPFTGGFAPACAGIESFSRNLAAELGVYGVRVVNIRSGGSPDSRTFKEALQMNRAVVEPILRSMENDTMLKHLPPMQDIANVAVFLASPLAAGITGTTVDVTCGTTGGFNYKVARPTELPAN